MNTNHRVTPVEHRIPGHIKVHFAHAGRPCWEICRGAHFNSNANFFQSSFHIFDLWFHAGPTKIYGQAEARIALHRIASRIQQSAGFIQIQSIVLNIGVVERAVGMDAGFGISGCALHQGLMDEIFIHGMGDRFAHPDIGERAFGGVHR